MDNRSMSKAHWARRKAAALWQQATKLDRDRSGDWRARARRRRGAALLREEAAQLERVANRLSPPEWDLDIAI